MIDIRKKLAGLMKVSAQSQWDLLKNNKGSIDEMGAVSDEIITAWDEMQAEIERLSWRYPENGELPKTETWVVTESFEGSGMFWLVYYDELDYNKKRDMERTERWRYIE